MNVSQESGEVQNVDAGGKPVEDGKNESIDAASNTSHPSLPAASDPDPDLGAQNMNQVQAK